MSAKEQNMLVFVDESGDAGLKLDRGSSELFVVTIVIFDGTDSADLAETGMVLLRKEMGLHPSFEFKFNKLNANRRAQILRRFAEFEFSYHCVVIDKKALDPSGLHQPESFYKFACSLAFESARSILKEAIAVIDGSGSKEFRQGLQKYLKSKINDERAESRCIAKVKLNDSSKNDLLQFADMICGAISRSYKNKPDGINFREIVKCREGDVVAWPK